VIGVASAQFHQGGGYAGGYQGGYNSGVQTLQSVPLPPPGYVSPSVHREKTEPPKPFSYKYESPDPYGGYSTHESHGDEYGRISGAYTVHNPDGTQRLVKYVADPLGGFNAQVDTNEEGTKTSQPANAEIHSTAPEEGYYPHAAQQKYVKTVVAAPSRHYRRPYKA